ncbi:MAG: CTP synthase, partial [Verrucomicrobiaceae bacterium]
ELPLMIYREKFDALACEMLHLHTREPDLTEWKSFVNRVIHPTKHVRIAVVGKYIELQDAYKSVYEALTHAGATHDCEVRLVRVDAEDLEHNNPRQLPADIQGVLIPGGFGDRGIEGKIIAAGYARENRVPYLGLCLGMQIATIEYARSACGLTNANSTEFAPDSPDPVICLMEEQKEVTEFGGSMRLGTWKTIIKPGSLAHRLYGSAEISERHRHRYEFNNDYRDRLQQAGLVISGTSPDDSLVEMIEVPDHPFFIASQFHPEFLSKPNHPHPLFSGFIEAALKQKK